MLISLLRANSIYVVLLNPASNAVLSIEQLNVGMRVRAFYEDEYNNELFITTDGFGLYKIYFEKVANFYK